MRRTGTAEDKLRYCHSARAVAKEIRTAKRQAYREFMNSIEEDTNHDIIGKVSRIAKARQKRGVRHTTPTSLALKYEDFTKSVATKFPPSTPIEGETFDVPSSFKKNIIE